MSTERCQECVATLTVDRAHPPKMSVELSAFDEVRERQLIESRRTLVGRLLRVGDRVNERRRDHEPPKPKPGREDLARRTDIDDAVGAETLDRADRLAVIPKLGVVVV